VPPQHLRRNEAVLGGGEITHDPRECAGDGEGSQSQPIGREPEGAYARLVVACRGKDCAEGGTAQPPGQRDDRDDQHVDENIEAGRRLDRYFEAGRRSSRTQVDVGPIRTAADAGVVEQVIAQLAEGERHQDEVEAARSDRQGADGGGERGCGYDRNRQRDEHIGGLGLRRGHGQGIGGDP